jgi:hypothetical protein
LEVDCGDEEDGEVGRTVETIVFDDEEDLICCIVLKKRLISFKEGFRSSCAKNSDRN